VLITVHVEALFTHYVGYRKVYEGPPMLLVSDI